MLDTRGPCQGDQATQVRLCWTLEAVDKVTKQHRLGYVWLGTRGRCQGDQTTQVHSRPLPRWPSNTGYVMLCYVMLCYDMICWSLEAVTTVTKQHRLG